MKVVVFGATGMVGNSVLRECLNDPRIDEVVTVGRNPSGTTAPKIVDIVHRDMLNFSAIEADLTGVEAASSARCLLRRHERSRLHPHHA